MGLYKELARAIETLNIRQQQIFPDAADFGVPVEKGSREWKALKAIGELARSDFKVERTETDYETGKNVRISFTIPWEMEGPYFLGQRYTLEYVFTKDRYKRKGDRDYCMIEISRVAEEVSPFDDTETEDYFTEEYAEKYRGWMKDIAPFM